MTQIIFLVMRTMNRTISRDGAIDPDRNIIRLPDHVLIENEIVGIYTNRGDAIKMLYMEGQRLQRHQLAAKLSNIDLNVMALDQSDDSIHLKTPEGVYTIKIREELLRSKF